MDEQQRMEGVLAAHRKVIRKVLARITVYYVVLATIVAIAVSAFPGIIDELPLGGVGDIANYSSSSVYDLEEAFLSADDEELGDIVTETSRARIVRGPTWLQGAISLLYAMMATLLLMLPVSWVYKSIHTDSIYDHSIDTTTLVLPAVVAGIVAGVRFRRALSDTFDALFILAAIGVGISAGIKSIEIAIVITVFFNYAAALVCAFGDGLESQYVVQEAHRKKRAKAQKAIEKNAKAGPSGPMSDL